MLTMKPEDKGRVLWVGPVVLEGPAAADNKKWKSGPCVQRVRPG